MTFIHAVEGLVFGLGVLLLSSGIGFAYWGLTLKPEEAEDMTARKIELGFYAGACIVFALLIAYWLTW
ncbi:MULTISPECIES: hypothetical protein [Salinivibrio]|uniref:Uncharacterized protein n=2 Tax=Salinivibrio TaxID=51366 RepID=A0ABY7LJE1_9GAMM|nr:MULTISPECIES: hypothetical protein [Salinivibrio]ODP95536.1 hypothetical protein BGK46_15760 [Salinivibrio sp. DV]OOF11299.1 hypothetical protein BZG82_04575 [Salinivibrio sp. PR5]OOF15648.1 hypothetical protein BZG84_11765 [Salinivibrio sp. PR932]OOF16105.1 hypothetical protein BZG83_01785 [Salinivibrio sp. PR919]OOF20775.1 hypothetical protein BZJ17_11280 [Salinivibrio sp. IB574]